MRPARITINDVRAAGLCVSGTRTWFQRHGLNFREFLQEGVPIETVQAIDDAMANRVVAVVQQHLNQDIDHG